MFEEEYTIGRSKRCSLRLSDLRVSGVHCRIRREGSTVTIVDKSTNGTFVNGKRQRKDVPRQLHNGDTITLSQAEPDTSENKAMGAYMFYDFEHRPVAPPEAKHRVDITSLYELRDELGRGTFGTVYLARRRSTGEEVAVKMVRKRKLQQQAYSMSEVEAEARMMVRMQHPYLAKLQGSWHDRDHIYLVMVSRGGRRGPGGAAMSAQPSTPSPRVPQPQILHPAHPSPPAPARPRRTCTAAGSCSRASSTARGPTTRRRRGPSLSGCCWRCSSCTSTTWRTATSSPRTS